MANTIIRASAGSGKTFQLSNRYLDIVFRNEPVETILASTFTRKAAGEITARILMRLAEAALDEKKCAELAKFVTMPRPIRTVSHSEGGHESPREIRDNGQDRKKTLQKILADLARNLFRLRISTLDSFFNKIASSFSLELGLPPGWSILEESNYARFVGEAVRKVLADSDRNEARKLMHMLQKGEQDRSVTRELFDLAAQLLPVVRESAPEAWNHEELLRPELDEKQLNFILEHLADAEVPVNRNGLPNANFLNVRSTLASKAGAGEWKDFLKSSLVQSVIREECLYYRIPVEGELLHCVRELIAQAHASVVNKLVAQTMATRKLLDLVAGAYDDILLRERRFRFEDITDRLGGGNFSPVLEILNHRLDARTVHLLLDEFQDTSMPQWKVIQALADDVARNAFGSFFCVGDNKQAIYAWRGGEAEIFNTIESTVPDVRIESLDTSFRSSPVVIDTVNKLFENIASNPALAEKHPEAAEAWAGRFEEHRVTEKNETLPGHCILEVAPDVEGVLDDGGDMTEESLDKEEAFLRYTVDRIKELHETRPGMSIGVLVARNRKIGPVIAGLKRYGIEASEEGGNALTDSAAVRHVLSAMILADHPGDRIARFHLAHGPLADELDLHDHDDDAKAAAASLRLRGELIRDGYGPVVERMTRQLAASCNPREFQRLEKLRELACRFQETVRGVRTQRFIDAIRSTRVESPSASPIRVMTIHKSKGLEFDIVVLPDLEKTLSRGTPTIVTDRQSPTDPIRMVIRYVGEDVRSLLPGEYQEAFRNRVRREVEESLSLLYVAVTRAVHELVMIVAPPSRSALRHEEQGKPTYASTFAGVLRAGLADTNLPPGSKILYEHYGKRPGAFEDCIRQVAMNKAERREPEPEWLECVLASKPAAPRRNLPRLAPSSLETAPTETDRPSSSGRSRDDARLWGTAMHACFEYGLRKTPWLDEELPETDELLLLVRRTVLGQKGKADPERVVEAFLKACEKPVVRAALSLKPYGLTKSRTARVEHERRFAVRLDEGRLLHGSVDRLVIFSEEGKIVGLDIIDYKTDRPDEGREIEDFLAERRKIYTPQLEAYRHGMSRLFRLDESRIGARLLFVEIDRVVEL